MAECPEGREIGRTDATGGGGAGRGDAGGNRFIRNYHNPDGGFGFGGGAGLGGESVGAFHHRPNDAVGVSDGDRYERGRRSEDSLGDDVRSVRTDRMCLGGKVGSGDSGFGEDVHVGSTDVGVVDHGIRTDGKHSSDLAVAGAPGLSELLFKNRNSGSSWGGGCDFGSATADACVDAIY